MSLLDQLRAGNTSNSSSTNHEKWRPLPDLIADAIPNYQHGKIVLIRGEVIVIGCVRTGTLPRYFYIVIHNEHTAKDPAGSGKFPHHELLPMPRPGNKYPVSIGVSRYKADSETNYYTDPWVGWVDHNPEDVAIWISEILNNTSYDTPRLEEKYRTGQR